MAKMEAVIFDMDGVLIDSEPFWKRAEQQVFASLGVQLSPELCLQTQAMTTTEVTLFWYERYPWTGKDLTTVENEVVDCVDGLITTAGTAIAGVKQLVETLKKMGYKIGLATNSPHRLIASVLNRLQMTSLFDAISSAEQEAKGKPDPAVYLAAAKKLDVAPASCIAFEDSWSGIQAAKAAGMKAIALISPGNEHTAIAALADACITTYQECDLSFPYFQ